MKEIEVKSPKESFLDDMKQYLVDSLPAKWDYEEKQRSMERTKPSRMKTAIYASIPMICRGKACPFTATCEYFKEGRAPEGDACPYESSLVVNFMGHYIDDLGIDVDNLIEMAQIRDLVDQDVQMLRKSKYLAKEDFIQDNVVGVDSDGDPIFRKELHPAIEWEDKIHRRRQVMLKQLLATRESKVKAGAVQIDSAQNMASLVETLRRIDKEQAVQMKRELGIVDIDEYIVEDSAEN